MKDASERALEGARLMIDRGEFAGAAEALRELAASAADPAERRECADELELMDRVRADFWRGEANVLELVRGEIPDARLEEIRSWAEAGALESRLIDGERRYYDRALVNLFRLSPEARARRDAFAKKEVAGDPGASSASYDLEAHMRRMLDLAGTGDEGYVGPREVEVDFAMRLAPGAVPEGETVRCWMPMPCDGGQNRGLAILTSEPAARALSSPEAPHRALYFEGQAGRADEATTFRASYRFETRARVLRVDPAGVRPYDESSPEYARYTEERRPHIGLGPGIRELSAGIVGEERNPYLKARRIFEWFDRNVTYTAAPEYSTIRSLSAFCLERRRGDCGIQAMLFIALCRAAGIPARWQSGLTFVPGRLNMHDWALFKVEPYGWLHADPSRGLRKSDDPEVRWFYFGNVDAYRLVVNEDFGRAFTQPKEHLRSETVDFQRGEMEWRGGNLYYDKWDYEWEVSFPKGNGD